MTPTAEQQTKRLIDYFPVQMNVSGQTIVFCGGQMDVLAKVRLMLKTTAELIVFSPQFCDGLLNLSDKARLTLIHRPVRKADFTDAVLCYIGMQDDAELQRSKGLAAQHNIPVCVIDNKLESDFLTPALIDHAPVTVAIGSEGYAPVLVRKLKALCEELIPAQTGQLAVYSAGLRAFARRVPEGYKRRAFWSAFFDDIGPSVLDYIPGDEVQGRLEAEAAVLARNLADTGYANTMTARPQVHFISAGPGGADLMTQRAVRILRDADIILYDRLVSADCLEFCRREADMIEVGKTGYGGHQAENWAQQDIDRLLVSSALSGGRVVRLKAGDAGLFSRLDEETEALSKAGISFAVVPGVTTASAMAAEMGVSLTKRGRNRELMFLTGHQLDGFAEHDWRRLGKDGAVTAVYMGKRAATWIQGRLMMFGASPQKAVSVAVNVGTRQADWHICTLSSLARVCSHLADGPVLILLGLHPHPASPAARKAVWHDHKPSGQTEEELVL